MRIIRIIVIWLVVAGAVFLAYKFIWPLLLPEDVETDIQTTVAKRDDMREVVPADGVVEPSILVEVQSKASGVVEEIFVEPGDVVAVGDILVELDKEELLANKRQAEASLSQAIASLRRTERNSTRESLSSAESSVRQAQISYDEAKETNDRIAALYEKGFATEDEMVTARANVDSAKEQLEQAKTQLELEKAGGEPEDIEAAQANVDIQQAALDDVIEELGNTTVKSPLAGTVLTRPVEVGSAVRSGTSGNSDGTVVATVGDLSTMYVSAQIEETDLGKVEIGASCRITFDAYPNWVWMGEVAKIYPQGEESNSGTQFEVDIVIDQHNATREGGSSMVKEKSGNGGMHPPMGMLAPTNWFASAAIGDLIALQGPPPGGGGPGGPPGGDEGDTTSSRQEESYDNLAPGEVPQLYSAMTANVEIVLEDHPNVIVLAAKYIQYDSDGTKFVEVLPDPKDTTKRERREIETGFSDGMRYEITSGLEEGDTVVLEQAVEEEDNMRMF